MISEQELRRVAATRAVKDVAFMEKDYALTWALKAIYSNKDLSNMLIFKGGTCLSKIYTENYRLSEDLDFSTSGKPTPEWFEQHLSKAFELAKAEGGPDLRVKKDDTHANPGHMIFQIQYNAILGQSGRLKLDISLNEHVMCGIKDMPLREKIYSDIGNFNVRCYALQEIALEKTRALFQRGKSRDYYDLWRILTEPKLRKVGLDSKWLREFLVEKCGLSNVEYKPELMFDENQLQEAKDHWEKSLGKMTPNLPKFDAVIIKLKDIFFEENELAEFAKDIKDDHLDDINRGEKTEPLLHRAVALLLQKINAKKKKSVIQALKSLHWLYRNKKYAPKLGAEEIKSMIKVANDKDEEIKAFANTVLKVIQEKNLLEK